MSDNPPRANKRADNSDFLDGGICREYDSNNSQRLFDSPNFSSTDQESRTVFFIFLLYILFVRTFEFLRRDYDKP